jgi:NAD-dependent protein deacetylase/lipoamidase
VESWQIVQQWLSAAASVAVLTGAGISAESGVPTFRGPGGLWRNHRPEDLATPQAFARDPLRSWEWYNWRRGVIATIQPNAGHKALVRIEERSPRFTLVTQNVDGLHDRAGSRNILKVHGDIWTLRCTRCARVWRDLRPALLELPPKCECGALARPGVVWFGEGLPEDVWREAVAATSACDVFLLVGTSAVVYPAAGLAELARSHGAKVIEINIEETPLSGHVDLCWRTPASEALPMLVE